MSVQAMSWVFDHSPTTGMDRLVLLTLANHADAAGHNAWPSIDRIASEALVHRATAIRCLARLKQAGAVVVERHGGGRFRTTTYSVVLEKQSQAATLSGPEKQSQETRETVAPVRPEPSLTVRTTPPTPRRAGGDQQDKPTNPRANGTNPRALAETKRHLAEAEERDDAARRLGERLVEAFGDEDEARGYFGDAFAGDTERAELALGAWREALAAAEGVTA